MGWIGLFVGAVAVLWAGRRLSKTGEGIALKGNIGFTWVGMVFIAGATALPEFFTSMSAILRERSPDLALGNCFGSIAFNIALLVVLDWAEKRGNLLSLGDSSIAFSASLCVCLMAGLGGLLYLGGKEGLPLGWGTFLVGGAYIWGMRMVHRHETGKEAATVDKGEVESNPISRMSWRRIWLTYLALACCIFFASILLAWSGEWVSRRTGLGSTFVGFLLVAACTSLPEATATVTSVRLGKVDMALGNIIGSNLFNIFIVCACDLVWSGPIAADCCSHHLLTIQLDCGLTAMVIMGIVYKTRRSIGRIGLDTLSIFLAYLLGILLLYRFAAGA